MLNKSINTLKNLFSASTNTIKFCPVCQSKVESFVPLPERYKGKVIIRGKEYLAYKEAEMLNYNEYSCPHCGASDRERFYTLYLQKFFLKEQKIENIKMIHFAPEISLRNLLKKYSFKEYRTADLMMDGVDDKADLTDLHFYKDNYFDFFICSHMLEHIPDDIKAMQELYRILKTGGKGILVVPILQGLDETYEDSSIVIEEERLLHFWQEDHVRMYNKQGYIERLKNVGFSIEEFNINNFSEKLFKEVAITNSSILYIVKK